MKIINITPVNCEYVDTTEKEYPTYVRYSSDTWCNVMGDSLEPVYSEDTIKNLEIAYREFKNA